MDLKEKDTNVSSRVPRLIANKFSSDVSKHVTMIETTLWQCVRFTVGGWKLLELITITCCINSCQISFFINDITTLDWTDEGFIFVFILNPEVNKFYRRLSAISNPFTKIVRSFSNIRTSTPHFLFFLSLIVLLLDGFCVLYLL